MAVVLTVPHSGCPFKDTKNRICDIRSEEAAFFIYQQLSEKGIPVYLFTTDVLRKEIDLNRRQTRNHPWRVHLRKRMDQIRKKHPFVILIDVHSFEHEHFDNYHDPHPRDAFFVFLKRKNPILSHHLAKVLTRSVVLPGIPINDIIEEFEDQVQFATLLEVNENQMSDMKLRFELDKLVSHLVQFVKNQTI